MISVGELTDNERRLLSETDLIYDSRDVAKEFKSLKRPLGELTDYIERNFIQIGVTDKGNPVYIRQ